MIYERVETAKRLKMARINAGYKTAQDLARMLNIPNSTYSNHENGKVEIKAAELAKYCTLLKVTADWLLFGKGKIS